MTLRTIIPLLALLAFRPAVAQENTRPNFLIVLADDLGYGDLAGYGHPRIKTPNLDRLARDGLRLTSCYAAAPNCSPARTGFMTGRNAVPGRRAQLDSHVLPHARPEGRDHGRDAAAKRWIRHLSRRQMASQRRLQSADSTATLGSWLQLLVFHPEQCPAESSQSRQLRPQRQTGRTIGGLCRAAGDRRGHSLAERGPGQDEAVLHVRLLPRAARADRERQAFLRFLYFRRSQLSSSSRQHHATRRFLWTAGPDHRRAWSARQHLRLFHQRQRAGDHGNSPARIGGPLARQEGVSLRGRHPRPGHHPLAGTCQGGIRVGRCRQRRRSAADALRSRRKWTFPDASPSTVSAFGRCWREHRSSGRRRSIGTSCGLAESPKSPCGPETGRSWRTWTNPTCASRPTSCPTRCGC